MHQLLLQCIDGLAAMRARTNLATADFYAKIGQPAPPARPRFKAVAKGKAWHIIEVGTGKTLCFCFSYKAALRFVDALEAAATRKLAGRQ